MRPHPDPGDGGNQRGASHLVTCRRIAGIIETVVDSTAIVPLLPTLTRLNRALRRRRHGP
jgi:hypothetical protein